MSLAWKEDKRPQRFGWAPGSYLCHCHGAGCKDLKDKTFIGDKRAVICADCAYALPDVEPPLTEESLRAKVMEMFRQIRKIEIELEKFMEGKK
jgi:hypothetical protein